MNRPSTTPRERRHLLTASLTALRTARDFALAHSLVIALAAMTFAEFVAYENIIFRGQSLVATANFHPFDNRPDRLNPRPGGSSVNWHDSGAAWWQWEPAARFFSIAYRNAAIVLWDPTIAGGVDAHVNVTQTQYFPPYVLLLLAGDTPGQRDFYYLGLLWMSGAACVLLGLRNGMGPAAAGAFAIMFILSGAMTQTVNSMVGQSFSSIPFVVLACDWLVDHPAWRRVAVLAVAVTLAVLTGFLPAVLSGLFLLPFLALIAAWQRWRVADPPRRRAALILLSRFALATIIGLALSGFLLVPLQAAAAATPEFHTWYQRIGLQHYGWKDFITLVSPVLTYDLWQSAPATHLFPSVGAKPMYVGLLPILLLVFSAPSDIDPRNRRLFAFFVTITLVLLLKLTGTPPAQWLGYLPILKNQHFIPYFMAAFTFGLTGLAAFGLDSLFKGRAAKWRYDAVTVVALLFFIGLLLFASMTDINPQGNWRLHLLDLARLMVLATLFVFVIRMRREERLGVRPAAVLVILLLIAELASLAHRTRFGRSDIWRNVPEYVRFLQADRDLFRIHGGEGAAVPANVNQALGLYGISSRHVFTPTRFATLVREYFDSPALPYPVAASLLPKKRAILNLLNVKYLIATSTNDAQALQESRMWRVAVDGSFQVFQNPQVWPRAYLATKFRVEPSKERALEAIGSLKTPTEVILEQELPGVRSIDRAGPAGTVRIGVYDYDEVSLVSRAAVPSLLVLLDNDAPGWSATVNGKPVPILVANYAFRAVQVPAGESRVRFRYRSPGLAAGLAASVLAALVIIGILVAPRLRQRAPTTARGS